MVLVLILVKISLDWRIDQTIWWPFDWWTVSKLPYKWHKRLRKWGYFQWIILPTANTHRIIPYFSLCHRSNERKRKRRERERVSDWERKKCVDAVNCERSKWLWHINDVRKWHFRGTCWSSTVRSMAAIDKWENGIRFWTFFLLHESHRLEQFGYHFQLRMDVVSSDHQMLHQLSSANPKTDGIIC